MKPMRKPIMQSLKLARKAMSQSKTTTKRKKRVTPNCLTQRKTKVPDSGGNNSYDS